MINLKKYIIDNFGAENSDGALYYLPGIFYLFFDGFSDIGVTSDKILRNGKIKRNVIEVELPYTIDAINVTKYFAKCCVDVKRVMRHLSSIVDVKNIQFKRYSNYTDAVYKIDQDNFVLNIIMRLYHPKSYTNKGSIHIMIDLLPC